MAAASAFELEGRASSGGFRGQTASTEEAALSDSRPSGLALQICLELCNATWGQVWLRAPSKPGRSVQTLPLYPPAGLPRAELLPGGFSERRGADELRGELLAELTWEKDALALEVHRVRGLAVPASQLGGTGASLGIAGMGGHSDVVRHLDSKEEPPATRWGIRVWLGPPGGEDVLLIGDLIPKYTPVVLTEHSMIVERTVNIKFPPTWWAASLVAVARETNLRAQRGEDEFRRSQLRCGGGCRSARPTFKSSGLRH
eukprot:TRINITY_DN40497_c0_g1_i1.p1 TRINITY_DN40497_c0_g1~~TRINITY_DN40497_c0_g1_i1.p1  ORF type:complete len:258 (-),score=45.08 TRINITY_DN40497_c0_g1_i1:31-804(-)